MKQNNKKRIDKRVVVPFCVCVLLVAILAGAIIWSEMTELDHFAEQYATALLQNDPSAVYSMYMPEAISYLLRETELTEKDMRSNLSHKMSLWVRKNVTDKTGALTDMEASLISKQNVPKETVEELETNFGVHAQSAKCLTVSYHAEGGKGSQDGEMTVYAVKISGNWYLYDLQMLLE